MVFMFKISHGKMRQLIADCSDWPKFDALDKVCVANLILSSCCFFDSVIQ